MNLLKIFKLLLLILTICVMLTSCSLLPNISMGSSSGAAQVKKYEEVYKHKADGEKTYFRKRTSNKIIPRKTFSQRIGSWISGLGIIAMLLLITGFILAPSTIVLFLLGLIRKWKLAFKQTVVAIKTSQAVNKDNELHNALKSSQSISTKRLVGDIKSKL